LDYPLMAFLNIVAGWVVTVLLLYILIPKSNSQRFHAAYGLLIILPIAAIMLWLLRSFGVAPVFINWALGLGIVVGFFSWRIARDGWYIDR
jgi:uncharacterized membrane protein